MAELKLFSGHSAENFLSPFGFPRLLLSLNLNRINQNGLQIIYSLHFVYLQVMSLSSSSNPRPDAFLHPCTVRHDSLFKAVWDWLILVLVIFTAIEIPFSVAFLMPIQQEAKFMEVDPLLVFNLWVDLMFIVDIVINFRTTFVKSSTDEVISCPKQIVFHYLKSWFVVDFVAAIPFEFMVLSEVEKVDSVSSFTKNI